MRTVLICILYLVYFLAIGLDVVAESISPSMIPPPKCGSPTCQCGCNSGEDCRCAFRD